MFYVRLSVAYTSSYCKILCLDALLQNSLFNKYCIFENSCYQYICGLINKYPTSDCPEICEHTMAHFKRIRSLRPAEEMGKFLEICSHSSWRATTPIPIRIPRALLRSDHYSCYGLCRAITSAIFSKPCRDRWRVLENCELVAIKETVRGDYYFETCPTICEDIAEHFADFRDMDRSRHREFCRLIKALQTTTTTPSTTTTTTPSTTTTTTPSTTTTTTTTTTEMTYPNEGFRNCEELCWHVFPKTLKPTKFFCPQKAKNYNPCTLSSCKEVNRGIPALTMEDGEDSKYACPKMCFSMAVVMRDRDMNRRNYPGKLIRGICSRISTSKTTTPFSTTTAMTYPSQEFHNCEQLCQHVFPKTLEPTKFFCPHKSKKYNPCTLSSCNEVISGILMEDGQDPEYACPKMCSSMAVEMRGRDMDRRQFDEKRISELCSGIVPASQTTAKPPTTKAATCPNEKFSSCKDLCEYGLSETLRDDPRLCWEGRNSVTLCVHYACEIIVRQNLMLEHVCPEMCPSMIAAVREVEALHPRGIWDDLHKAGLGPSANNPVTRKVLPTALHLLLRCEENQCLEASDAEFTFDKN
ncbi:hypothetical protein RB195_016956 [Necator americanus]|uniref:Uncharacterized protein n=1 Tax=Necator americanus TaxID=51031 RepID=A0ABR1C2X0_NECAM